MRQSSLVSKRGFQCLNRKRKGGVLELAMMRVKGWTSGISFSDPLFLLFDSPCRSSFYSRREGEELFALPPFTGIEVEANKWHSPSLLRGHTHRRGKFRVEHVLGGEGCVFVMRSEKMWCRKEQPLHLLLLVLLFLRQQQAIEWEAVKILSLHPFLSLRTWLPSLTSASLFLFYKIQSIR